MDDRFYSEILNYYTASEHKYPEQIYNLPHDQCINAKSMFRQSVKPYKVKAGIDLHSKKQVLVKSKLASILRKCHNNQVSGGHFGQDKIFNKISL